MCIYTYLVNLRCAYFGPYYRNYKAEHFLFNFDQIPFNNNLFFFVLSLGKERKHDLLPFIITSLTTTPYNIYVNIYQKNVKNNSMEQEHVVSYNYF